MENVTPVVAAVAVADEVMGKLATCRRSKWICMAQTTSLCRTNQ